jgi:hypothetical protein
VAGKYEEKERVQEVMAQLIKDGHTITYDWTRHDEGFTPRQAKKDMDGVVSAQALVMVAEKDLPYKGSLVEMGMMLACGRLVWILGNAINDCIFTKLYQVRYGFPPPVTVFAQSGSPSADPSSSRSGL